MHTILCRHICRVICCSSLKHVHLCVCYTPMNIDAFPSIAMASLFRRLPLFYTLYIFIRNNSVCLFRLTISASLSLSHPTHCASQSNYTENLFIFMMHFSLLRLFMQAHYNPSISTNSLFISFFSVCSPHSFT